MSNEQLKAYRELAKKLVTAGADLHYKSQRQETLLASLLSSSPLQTFDYLILEWLHFLADCGIDVENYALRENRFSDGEPFEVDDYHTIVFIGSFAVLQRYTCIHRRTFRFEFDNIGRPIPKVLRWVDPDSPTALVLKEFGFCQNLIINSGAVLGGCHHLRKWISLWERSPQDLRDVPIGALYMLSEMGWDFERRRVGTSIFPADQNAIWLLDQGCDGFPEEFLQKLAMMPEIILSGYPKLPQKRGDQHLERIQATESTRAIKVSYGSCCRDFRFCNCDAFGNYLDLWPFHGSTNTLCQSGNKLDRPCLVSEDPLSPSFPWEDWCGEHKCTFNHARFERKMTKRIAKRCTLERKGMAKCSMPGSWPC